MQQHSFSKSLFFILSLILLSLSFTFSSKAQNIADSDIKNADQPLRIAVSSNFTPALKKLLVEFHQQTNIKTQIISGATGAMFIQIQHGAPFDIFLSADSLRPEMLEQQELIVPSSRKTYAYGQLALLSMNSEAQLKDLNVLPTRFAIANPDTAPYGKAAQQVLEHLGLWHEYQPALIIGMNINQTFSQVRTQAVNSGLVANSQLVLNQLKGVIIPTDYYQPIAQQLVIMKNSPNINNAIRLSDYLLSPHIKQKIISFGYAELKQPKQAMQERL